MNNIHYKINPKWPERHVFEVTCTIPNPDPKGQRFSVPAWIPGSYLIRDFAKHITRISAHSSAGPVALVKEDKHTWQAAACVGPLKIVTEVYAYDLSVRGAHFDDLHAFFNGTSLYLNICGQENNPVDISLLSPAGEKYNAWRVATSLPATNSDARGFGDYTAADYAEAIDHPVEMAALEIIDFNPTGVPHQLAIFGAHRGDAERLQIDLHKICATIIEFFPGGAPFKSYVFLLTVLGAGHGGLEHRASSALMASRDDLVCKELEPPPNYRDFLSLVSHEYFHAWNVKRIKPEKFIPYDLNKESYTELLWVFEGFTVYYQDLFLVRAGLISQEKYFEVLATDITRLYKTKGRTKQSVCECSFDAWTRFYQQDSNGPNAIISYYLKGGLIGLVLDLHLRVSSNGAKSLDDVMRYLWLHYGQTGLGVAEGEMAAIIFAATAISVDDLLNDLITTTQELPLSEYLAKMGITMHLRAPVSDEDIGSYVAQLNQNTVPSPILGAKWIVRNNEVVLQTLFEEGPAQLAGLAPEDVLVAFDGFRINANNLNTQLKQYTLGDTVLVSAFRNDTLIERAVVLQNSEELVCELAINQSTPLLTAWLKGSAV